MFDFFIVISVERMVFHERLNIRDFFLTNSVRTNALTRTRTQAIRQRLLVGAGTITIDRTAFVGKYIPDRRRFVKETRPFKSNYLYHSFPSSSLSPFASALASSFIYVFRVKC